MSYAIDETDLERQELLGDVFEPTSRRLLQRLPVEAGAECLDLGCGIGRTTSLLCDELPEPGRVVGLDADGDLLEVARSRVETDGATDVEFRTGDAADLPYEDDAFDVVYARFLLTHLPEPEPAVEEFRRVCRPGGVVAVQEPDFASVGTWPPSTAYERAEELTDAIFDAHMGRKATSLLRDAGIEDTEVEAVVPVETEGTTLRRLSTLSLAAIGAALVENGVIDEEEHERIVADARQVEGDEDRLAATYTVYSVWGCV